MTCCDPIPTYQDLAPPDPDSDTPAPTPRASYEKEY